MTEPYLGEDKTTGVWMWEDAELGRMVLDAACEGLSGSSCHAIGDAAIEQLITAYEKALAAHPDPDRRHRIEHCGFSTPAQHERMVKAGIYHLPAAGLHPRFRRCLRQGARARSGRCRAIRSGPGSISA